MTFTCTPSEWSILANVWGGPLETSWWVSRSDGTYGFIQQVLLAPGLSSQVDTPRIPPMGGIPQSHLLMSMGWVMVEKNYFIQRPHQKAKCWKRQRREAGDMIIIQIWGKLCTFLNHAWSVWDADQVTAWWGQKNSIISKKQRFNPMVKNLEAFQSSAATLKSVNKRPFWWTGLHITSLHQCHH